MGTAVDLRGQKFNRLTAIRPTIQRAADGGIIWECQCDCGNTAFIKARDIKSGNVKSCGCLVVDNGRRVGLNGAARITHGMTNTRLYHIRTNMIQRCTNSKNNNYKHYGGRGVKICEEWRNSFEAFYEWAMSNGYADNLTIDREDNDGDYEPGNCRWVTNKENNNNKGDNVFVEIGGEVKTLKQWSDISGLRYGTIIGRFAKGLRGAKLLGPVQEKYRNRRSITRKKGEA